ncbi:ATP synthase F1 subunit delta [Candidatus Dependentiae bacterium]|nr:ATP synthase F1 subunit delta [Candidatus Dependentiae bacterium]
MVIKQKIIARKYACAFLNLYFDALSPVHIEGLIGLQEFLRDRKGILSFLSLPSLTDQAAHDFLTRLYDNFCLPVQFGKLVQQLLDRGNVYLLPVILQQLLQEYWIRRRVLLFNIASSHALNADEQARIIAFLTKQTGAAEIKANFSVNAALICGIQMKSDMYMFEHSIARELKKIKESLLQRVQL